MSQTMPLLSLAIWTPIAGAVLVWLLAGDRRPARARTLALLISLLEFAITVPLYTGFDASSGGLQFVERLPWVESFAIYYHLGIDGIALPFILLTSFVTVLVVAMARVSVDKQLSQYLGAFLVMEGLMIGLFCAVDAMLFYVFWEAMLIPMFIIIGIWGGPNRVYATLKFFLYTFLGSVLLLVALIYLHLKTGSFSLLDFQRVGLDLPTQKLLFLAFLAAFAVKIPMWPVHTWLPDAHVEAPTGGSVVL
ncbi:MAG: NuoM family protein, partial [Thiomonas sp.]